MSASDEREFEHETIDDALDLDRRLARLDRKTRRVVDKLDRVEEGLDRAERQAKELLDTEFTQALAYGPLLGIPAVFTLVLAMALWSGFSFLAAFFVALWPAVVVGPYVGGLALLAHRYEQLEWSSWATRQASRRRRVPGGRTRAA